MNYRVRGLDGSRFDFLYGLSDEDLARARGTSACRRLEARLP